MFKKMLSAVKTFYFPQKKVKKCKGRQFVNNPRLEFEETGYYKLKKYYSKPTGKLGKLLWDLNVGETTLYLNEKLGQSTPYSYGITFSKKTGRKYRVEYISGGMQSPKQCPLYSIKRLL